MCLVPIVQQKLKFPASAREQHVHELGLLPPVVVVSAGVRAQEQAGHCGSPSTSSPNSPEAKRPRVEVEEGWEEGFDIGAIERALEGTGSTLLGLGEERGLAVVQVPGESLTEGDTAEIEVRELNVEEGADRGQPQAVSVSECHTCYAVFHTARGLAQHMRFKHSNENKHPHALTAGRSQQDSGGGSSTCTHCKAGFTSARGLGQHMRQRHPFELNEARRKLSANRRFWTPQDDAALLEHANKQSRNFATRMALCKSLCQLFTGRTSEAIDLRLKTLKWARPICPVGRDRNPNPQADSEPSTAGETVREEAYDQWFRESAAGLVERMSRAASGDEFRVDKIQGHTLLDIAEKLRAGTTSIKAARKRLQQHATLCFPHKRQPTKVHEPCQTKAAMSKKRQRRANYAAIQALYGMSKKDAAETVLSGGWKAAYKGRARVPREHFDYWAKLFEGKAVEDKRPIVPKVETNWGLISPITSEEVCKTIRELKNTATGLDRVSVSEVNGINRGLLVEYLNLLLLTEAAPGQLSKARVTLVPKTAEALEPGDYRPIAVTSILLRLLHKILARRWSSVLKLDSLQVGFQPRDGCMEANLILLTALRLSHEKHTPLAAAFVDVAKAFDTVSHETIIRAAISYGAPSPLVNYLRALYSRSEVTLDGKRTIVCNRGVRQGDPLSPLLFIMVMEEVLELALPRARFEVCGFKAHALAYADDLVVFANNADRLKEKLVALEQALSWAGMTVNAGKSHTLTIDVNTKLKQCILIPTSYTIHGEALRPMGVNDRVKYLGLCFTWKSRERIKHTAKLEDLLQQLSSAPLKPQQRVCMLRDYALPRLQYELVLGDAHSNTLKRMDVMVRRRMKAWLRFPHDTPSPLFYVGIGQGGLGIPQLAAMIPLLRRERLQKVLARDTNINLMVRPLGAFKAKLKVANRNVTVNHELISNKSEYHRAMEKSLYGKADGRELGIPDVDPDSFRWIRDPGGIFPRLYIRGLQLRAGVLGTKVRKARQRGIRGPVRTMPFDTTILCRGGCGQPESIGHILQKCSVTHEARCARHNRIVQYVAKLLKQSKYQVTVEPIIPVTGSFRKPDIVAVRNGIAHVIDVAVVTGIGFEVPWRLKVDKYSNLEVHAGIRSLFGENVQILHSPLLVTNRGLIYRRSAAQLRALGLTGRDVGDICLLAIRGSLKEYDVYMKGT